MSKNLISTAVDNMFAKNLDEMRNNLNAALTSKAVEALDERKHEIAHNYFAQTK